MRTLTYSALIFLLSSLSAVAEVVQTTDGRSVDLREDGTYEFVEATGPTDRELVEYGDHYFEHHQGEFGQKSVRFMPIYKNVSDRKIVGVKFTARFLNSFGEEIFKFSGDSDEPVASGKKSTANLFYNLEDNPFINGEPYDKLLPMVTNKSGSIKVALDMIAFDDGDIVKLSN